MAAPILTQDYLKSLLHYDPVTGLFTRIKKRSGCEVGDVAGTSCNGYIAIMIDCRLYYAARLAFLYMEGEMPLLHVDHIDGNPSNNSWVNLRLVTHSENQRNQKLPRHNTSGHMGVGWDKQCGKWVAQIMVNNKTKKLGRFARIEDAIAARKAANIKYNFHPNHGRTL